MFDMNRIDFKAETFGAPAAVSVAFNNSCGEVVYYKVTVDYPQKLFPERIKLHWFVPFGDIYSCWTPGGRFNHGLYTSWRPLDTNSRSASGAPEFALISKGGENRCTFAVSDAATPMRLTAGVEESTGDIHCTIELFTSRVDEIMHYEALIRLDFSKAPYYKSITDVRKWWSELGYTPAQVPCDAKRAMFSSWYNFQKTITEESVFEQCVVAKRLGMNTVILDDGWQTDEQHTGYTHCGDWVPAPSKFPDMRRFVDRLHAIGMKCILWYSVPFVGIYAENIHRFEGKYLRAKDGSRTVMCLDPRFPDVRSWLVETYESAVRDWDLDGLKLDFIDSFSLAEDSSTEYDKMDCPSLEAAVEKLLNEITDALRKIKPKIMIEFRQSYIGPIMQKYGNILRVGDCAGGSIINRVSSIDLRLLTDNGTAVHSDMLLWDLSAAPEGAADQLSNILFCVPQISIMPDKLPPEHEKMLKYYLEFMDSNRDVLLDGELVPLYPEANYAQVYARKGERLIAALYSDPMFFIPEGVQDITIVNALGTPEVYIGCHKRFDGYYTVRNCLGDLAEAANFTLDDSVLCIEVPHNGFLEIKAE